MKNKKEITLISIAWTVVILVVSVLVKDHPQGPFFNQFTVTGAVTHYFIVSQRRKRSCQNSNK